MRVFIADDSKILRSRFIEMLKEIKEIEIVGEAQCVQEAIKSIRELIPDIVILDIKMPDGNGMSVLEAIKKYNIVTKVIIFTNYPYLQFRKRCLDAGADFFFYKVTEFDKLKEAIKKLLHYYPKAKN